MKKSTRKGTRPQTDAEAKEIKRITHSKFPKAFNQDAHERKRHPDGRVIQPKPTTESIVNSYRDLGYLIAEIGRANPNNSPDNSPSEVPGMFTGKFKKLKNWIQGKLASKKKPKAWSEEERAKQKKKPSKKPTLGDAVNLAKPHKTTKDPYQDALDNANDAIDQRDREKKGLRNRGGIDPSL